MVLRCCRTVEPTHHVLVIQLSDAFETYQFLWFFHDEDELLEKWYLHELGIPLLYKINAIPTKADS